MTNSRSYNVAATSAVTLTPETTLAVPPPPSYNSGDTLFLCVAGAADPGVNTAPSTPSGWTALSPASNTLGVFHKTAGSNETAVTVTFASSCFSSGFMVAYPPATIVKTGFSTLISNSISYTPVFPTGVTASETVLLFAFNENYGPSGNDPSFANMALPSSWEQPIPPIGPLVADFTTTSSGPQPSCIGLAEFAGSTSNPTITSTSLSNWLTGFVVITVAAPTIFSVTALASGTISVQTSFFGGVGVESIPAPPMVFSVKALTGADSVASIVSGGANNSFYSAGASDTPDLAITPNASGSVVYGAVVSWEPGAAYTAASNTTFNQNFYAPTFPFDNTMVIYDPSSVGLFRSTSTTTASTPVTLGATSPSSTRVNIALAEILASGTIAETVTAEATGIFPWNFPTGSVQQTAIFASAPAAGTLLVAQVAVNSNYIQNGIVTMSISDTSGLTWTPLIESNTESGAYAGIWIAQVPTIAKAPVYILNDDFNGGSWTDSGGTIHQGSSGLANSLPSTAIWNIPTGVAGSSFEANTELAYYTGSTSNLFQDGNSNLCFTVGKVNTDGASGNLYPSGYVDTSASPGPQHPGTPKYSVQLGQSCEIRVKVNPLNGLWTACWFIGANSSYNSTWSEIDMEEAGDSGQSNPLPGTSNVTVWGGGVTSPSNPPLGTSGGFNVADGNYHIFRLDYVENQVSVYIDGTLDYTLTPSTANAGGDPWNFNSNGGMYVVLQIHMSQANSGTPVATSLPFEGMLVDYVRIWAPAGPDPNTVTSNTTSTGSVRITKPTVAGTVSNVASGVISAVGKVAVPKPSVMAIGNGGTGGGGAGSTGSLTDTFASNDLASLWANSYGTFTVADAHFRMQCDTSYSTGLSSTSNYSLVGSSVFGQFLPYQTASSETGLQLYLDANDNITIGYSGGTIFTQIKQAGVVTSGPSITYSPIAHAWWKISELNGTITFWTAPDGVSWTAQWTTLYTMAITALAISAYCGSYATEPTGTSYITSINVAPSSALALVDGFTSNDLSTLWSWAYGTVAVAGNRCSIQADTAYDSGIVASTTYNLIGSQVAARMYPYIAASGETGLQLSDSDPVTGNYLQIAYVAGNLQFNMQYNGTVTSGTPVAYNATTHAYWRLREATGTAYFETSPNGTTWTTQWSVVYAFGVSALMVQLYAGDFGSDATGTAYVTNVNVGPVTSTGSVAVPKPSVSGVIGPVTTSTGSIALPKPSVAGSGTVVAGFSFIGTPTLTRSTSGSVTPVFGTGQVDTVGDLLIAVITAAAATSVTAPSTPSGWTLIKGEGDAGTPHAYVAAYYLVAVGSDVLPAWTSTLTGTGAMTATIYEITTYDTAGITGWLDSYGVYAS